MKKLLLHQHPNMRAARVLGCTAILTAALVSGSCGSGSSSERPTGPTGPDGTVPAVASILVAPDSTLLTALGDTTRYTAAAKDAQQNTVTGITFAWTSSDTTVATVDPATGLVTSTANGSATITAVASGISGSAGLRVMQSVMTISVTPAADTLVALGGTIRFTATATDALQNAVTGTTFAWTSSDTTVATVDAGTGLITSLANGSVTITAVASGISGSAGLLVMQSVMTISVTPAADTLVALGGTIRFTATATDGNGNSIVGAVLQWSSSDTTVVRVDASSGLAMAVANGSVSITALADGGVGSAALRVFQEVVSVNVTPAVDTISGIGNVLQFSAIARDPNDSAVTSVPFIWLSSNHNVAVLDTNGLATSTGEGTAVITAATRGVPGSATLIVAAASQMSINAGDGQSATVGAVVAVPPSVFVTDRFANPVSGVAVTFAVTRGGGTVNPTTAISTDTNGLAAVTSWTLGKTVGSNTLTASSTGLTGSPLTVMATATVSVAAQMSINAGDGQSATVGAVVAVPPSVLVTDQFGNPVSGVAVTFAVASGGGTVNPTTAISTDTNGLAAVTSWTLGKTVGSNTLTAVSVGLTGSPVTFNATATIATGMLLSLTSSVPTNEFLVTVDGGAFGTNAQVTRVLGNSMTSASTTVGVPAGSGYRVRAVALLLGSGGTFPVMSASGKAEGVAVVTGNLTNVSVSLAAPTVVITAPTSVSAGQSYTISWTYTDPGDALDRTGQGRLDGRIHHSSSAFGDLTGAQTLAAIATQNGPTSYSFEATLTAPLTPGTIFFQAVAQIFNISVSGLSRAGWFIDPSTARGEALRQITVNWLVDRAILNSYGLVE